MMRKHSYLLFKILTFVLLLFLLSHILVPKETSVKYVENFTPGIRKLVRPQLRNARIVTEEYKEYFTDKTNESLKMLGLQFV
jgi:hypothetical protein